MTATTIRVQMAQRKDTAANWTSANPILLSGEIGYETDTKKFKIGNGSTNWNSLAYLPIPDGSGNLTITGNLEIGSTGSLTFEGSTADGFETTLAVTNPTGDRTITLPDRSGTVITSGDTGTVTSTMLADGTIVNDDVNVAAAIAGTKISPDFGSQTVQTTGIFSHALGSAAAPTVTFTGDTNTGIYSPGADQVAISTGGSGRLFVDSNGKVSARRARSNTSGQVGFEIAPSDSTVAYGFRQDQANNSFFLDRVDNASTLLSVTSAGLVGVGTSSPGYKLDVSVATNDPTTGSPAAGSFVQVAGGTTTVGNGPSIVLSNTSGAKETFWRMSAVTASGNNGDLVFNGYNGGASYPERLRITAAGNVGIGTTPAERLHVSGGNVLVQTTAGNNCFIDLAANGAGSQTSSLTIAQQSNGESALFNRANAAMYFATNGTERARIDSSGRLLVGTSSDSGGALLQVNGDRIRVGTAKTPASATATGTAGEICWDASYVYVCTATNTWKRSALSTW